MLPGRLVVCLAVADEVAAGAVVVEVLVAVALAVLAVVVLAAVDLAVAGNKKIFNKNASIAEAFLFGGISLFISFHC